MSLILPKITLARIAQAVLLLLSVFLLCSTSPAFASSSSSSFSAGELDQQPFPQYNVSTARLIGADLWNVWRMMTVHPIDRSLVYVADYTQGRISTIDVNGHVTFIIQLEYPTFSLLFDEKGETLYASHDSFACITKINMTSLQAELYLGTPRTGLPDVFPPDVVDGPKDVANFTTPSGMVIDNDTNTLYVCDKEAFRIRAVDMNTGYITTYAGQDYPGHQNGPVSEALINWPYQIYIVNFPESRGGRTKLFSDVANNVIYAINSTDYLYTFAGRYAGVNVTGMPVFDGYAAEVYFNQPLGMLIDPEFNVFVCDSLNNRVRVVTYDGMVRTIAGNGATKPYRDGLNATMVQPSSLIMYEDTGNILLCDSGNLKIRVLSKCVSYEDRDGDGFGNPMVTTPLCEAGPGWVANGYDCNDNDDTSVPSIYYFDNDGDGFGNSSIYMYSCEPGQVGPGWVIIGLDCDDDDNTSYPTVFYRDADGDGYGNSSNSVMLCQDNPPAGYVTNALDCDDTNAELFTDCGTSRTGTIVGAVVGVLGSLILVKVVIAIIVVVVVINSRKRVQAQSADKQAIEMMPMDAASSLSSRSSSTTITSTSRSESAIATGTEVSINIEAKNFIIPHRELTYGEKLGGGAFATVYAGEWGATSVAIKDLKFNQIMTSNNATSFIREFEQEVSMLGSLSHRNILTFYGACCEPPHLAIVTELMSETLYEAIHVKRKPMTWVTKLRIALDVCKGVEYMHRRNIIHRDLKSQNILLDSPDIESAVAKVSDFGLARLKNDSSQEMMTAGVGTPIYMSPEILLGQPYTIKADVFSFAMIMFELLTCKMPFHHEKNKIAIHMRICNDENYRPQVSVPGDRNGSSVMIRDGSTPEAREQYEQLMRRCWAHSPDDRPSLAQVDIELTILLDQALKALENEKQ